MTPKTGGSVTMVMDSIPAGLDAGKQRLWSFADGPIMNAIYGSLIYEDPQSGVAEMGSGFLQSATSTADYATWTLKLKPNLKFSDDTPFDAESVKYNWTRIADPATASVNAPVANNIASMTVVDAVTLQLTLKSPIAAFPNVIAESLGSIGSPTAMKRWGNDFGLHPVGAGPFKFESLSANSGAVVVKNPGYAAYAPGQPYLDKITFTALADWGQQATALQTGQAQLARPYGGAAIQRFADAGVNTKTNFTSAGQNVVLNNKIAPFNDPKAREALFNALERTPGADAFQAGTAAMNNIFASTSPFYDKKYDLPTPDKAKAQKLFDELAAAGKPLEFSFTTIASPLQAPFAAYLQAALASFKNVKVTVKALPFTQYSADLRSGQYQALPNGLYQIAPVPAATDWWLKNGVLNVFGWDNPTAETALQTILKTDPKKTDELKKLWGTVQEQLIKDNPVIWFGKGTLGFAWSKDMVNVHIKNLGLYPDWAVIGYKP